ncbi:MAG: hypothetical protein D6705_18515 [Deltaproteobacteria bacterium]|nr:MAG: hypothetical protein D6705_18515 [Deltaproteobacteria bacterium]
MIDGQEVTVRKGTNVLEAAKLLGKDISHFCYHPGLSIAASCRQCLVEIEKAPKLTPSCQAIVADGMVVHTDSPRVQEARRQMLEFTLKNHPVDCPICDKAGECILQRHYMDHDHRLSRVDVPKVRKAKHKDIGREIVLDQERCILCSRCVRFCEEVPKTAELGMMFRGDREILDIDDNRRLDNPYSLNVVDICPVGALTSKDFRFKIRAWELHATATTCNGCATGCAIELHHKDTRAYRIVPRLDPDVNSYWMCDAGRMTYKELDPDLRIHHARVDGETAPLAEAIAEAARRLRGKRTAVVYSAVETTEANLALAEVAKVLDATEFLARRPEGEVDDLLQDADKNPNLRGARRAAPDASDHMDQLALEIAGAAYEAVVFLGGLAPLSDVARQRLSSLASVCITDRRSELSDACAIVLPAASWAEVVGSYVNRQNRLRVLRPAFPPLADRRHPADLLHHLAVALGATDVPDARAHARALAEAYESDELRALVDAAEDVRPPLLRWAHMRG